LSATFSEQNMEAVLWFRKGLIGKEDRAACDFGMQTF